MLFGVETGEKPKVSKSGRNGKPFLRIRVSGRAVFLPGTEWSSFSRQGPSDFENRSLGLLCNVNALR